jgi:hypothetical protein
MSWDRLKPLMWGTYLHIDSLFKKPESVWPRSEIDRSLLLSGVLGGKSSFFCDYSVSGER